MWGHWGYTGEKVLDGKDRCLKTWHLLKEFGIGIAKGKWQEKWIAKRHINIVKPMFLNCELWSINELWNQFSESHF